MYRKEWMPMKQKAGEVFSISKTHVPVPGCTISDEIASGDNKVMVFSLAENTDISAEIYSYHKLVFVNEGELEVYGTDGTIGNSNFAV